MKYEKLFERGKIGQLELRNRVVMTAMGVHMGEWNGCANADVVRFYEERAKGGCGGKRAGGSADPGGKRAGGPGGTYPGGKRADDGGAGNLNKTNPEGGKKNVTRSIRNGRNKRTCSIN